MPFKSKAQKGLMYAAAEGKSAKVPKSVAEKFIADSGGGMPGMGKGPAEKPMARMKPPVRGRVRKVPVNP